MSLITRCPACQTMFKVVPDQLRISDGWVRCGQCGEVFDASQHLLPKPGDEATPSSEKSAQTSQATVAGSQPRVVDVSADATLPAIQPMPAPVQIEPATTAQHFDEPAPDTIASEPQWVEPALASPPAPIDVTILPDDDAPAVSFMRNGEKKSPWRRPMVRILLLLLVLFLVAALAAQILIHERNRIASMLPSTRPLLLVLCAWSRCELTPLRQIESIVIDSSSFGRLRGDNYRLGFSLRNNSTIDLAMPAIELALTDPQDQALIRRVILPTEFGAASRLLAAQSDWSSSLSLSVKIATNTDRISGYRLLAFYP